MVFQAQLKVISKFSEQYKRKDNSDGCRYQITYMQNGGRIVGNLVIREDIYKKIQESAVYEVHFEEGEFDGKKYNKILDFFPIVTKDSIK